MGVTTTTANLNTLKCKKVKMISWSTNIAGIGAIQSLSSFKRMIKSIIGATGNHPISIEKIDSSFKNQYIFEYCDYFIKFEGR